MLPPLVPPFSASLRARSSTLSLLGGDDTIEALHNSLNSREQTRENRCPTPSATSSTTNAATAAAAGGRRRRSRFHDASCSKRSPSLPPRAVAPGGDFLEDFDAIAALRRGKAPSVGGSGGGGGNVATSATGGASSSSSSMAKARSAGRAPAAPAAAVSVSSSASTKATKKKAAAEELLLFNLAGDDGDERDFEDDGGAESVGIFLGEDEEALVVAAAMDSSLVVVDDEGEEEEGEEEEGEEEKDDVASSPSPPPPPSQPALTGAAAAAAALRAELKECSTPEDVLDVAADEVGGGLSPACATALLERLAALERSGGGNGGRGGASSSSPAGQLSARAACERSPAFLALLDEVEAAAAAGAMRPRDLAQSLWALGVLRALRGRSSAAARALAAAAADAAEAAAAAGSSPSPSAPQLTGRDLASIFHGLGSLRADPGRSALSRLGDAAAGAARDGALSPQSLSMVCWGLASLCSPSSSASGGGSSSSSSNKAGSASAPPPGLVDALGDALAAFASRGDGGDDGRNKEQGTSSESGERLTPQALSVSASALARLRWSPPRAAAESIGRAIARAAHPDAVAADDARARREAADDGDDAPPPLLDAGQRTSFRPRELTSALFSLAEWRHPSPEALSSAAARLAGDGGGGRGPGGEGADATDWASAVWSLASLGAGRKESGGATAGDDSVSEAAWRNAERALARAAPSMPVRALSNALWGLAVAERFGDGDDGEGTSPSAFDALLAAALEAAEEQWPLDSRAVAQIARAHASAAVLRRASPSSPPLPELPPRLAAAAERRRRASASASPMSLTHARVAALARDCCGLPVSGTRVAVGAVGLPVVDVALELKREGSDSEPPSTVKVAVQVHCPREAPSDGDSVALLGRAASASRLLRALGWLPVVVRPQDVPSSAPRAAQAAALMEALRRGVASALATDSESSPRMTPREAEAEAAALLSCSEMKLTAADFVSSPSGRRGGGRGGGGRGGGGGGGGGRGRSRNPSPSSPRRGGKFPAIDGWGEVA